jgi:nicotinamidase-related amidase
MNRAQGSAERGSDRGFHDSCGRPILHAAALAARRRVHQDREQDATRRLPQAARGLWPHVGGDLRSGLGEQAVGAAEPQAARGGGAGQAAGIDLGRDRRELSSGRDEASGPRLRRSARGEAGRHLLSLSSCGQSGPDSHFAGYAPLFGAWGGLGWMTGYTDGPPVEMRHVMDHSAGMHAAVATMAALHQRRRTGKAQHVDLAAREVASAMIGDALIQASLGLTPVRPGNRHLSMAPHGVYPTRQPDRWLTLAVRNDAEWQALGASWINRPPRATRALPPPRLACGIATSSMRCSQWLAACKADATAERLQRAGVCAHVSWSMQDIARDPHLRARGATTEVSAPGHSAAACGRCAGAILQDARGRHPAADAGARPGRGLRIRRASGSELGATRRPGRREVILLMRQAECIPNMRVFDREHSIYLALDMENDLVHADGPNGKGPYGEQSRARRIVENTRRALDKAACCRSAHWLRPGRIFPRLSGVPGQLADLLGRPQERIFKLGEWGTQVHPDLGQQPGDFDIVKHRVSPFHGTDLDLVICAPMACGASTAPGISTNAVVQAACARATTAITRWFCWRIAVAPCRQKSTKARSSCCSGSARSRPPKMWSPFE